jgi:hypothetical protein
MDVGRCPVKKEQNVTDANNLLTRVAQALLPSCNARSIYRILAG